MRRTSPTPRTIAVASSGSASSSRFFFAYIASLTAKGAFGALTVGFYHLRAWLARDADAVEHAKIARLGTRGYGPSCAINRVIERADRPGEPLVLAIRDRFGSMGAMRVDGVRIDHLEAHRDGSNNIFPFLLRQVGDVTGTRPEELAVLAWRAVNDERFHAYVASVAATRALGRRLGDDAVWPRITLTPQQCDELEHEPGDELEATVTNRSHGQGQVEIQIHLRDRASGKTVDDDRDLDLRPHEAAHFTADIAAPTGDWSPAVTAQYPPR